MFPLENHVQASTAAEAVSLLSADPNARLIAGGTDVLIRLREGKKSFARLVDIHDLQELKSCEITADESLRIGAGVTFAQAIASETIRQHLPHLATAAATVGGPQIRNLATIGGNICNGVTSADSASPLLVSNTRLQILGPSGMRETPLSEFYLGPGKVALAQNEILIAFIISRSDYKGISGDFFKYAMREAMDIATIGCAAACRVENGNLADLRLAFGVAAPTPIRCESTEKAVIGAPVNPSLIERISAQVEHDVNPRTSWRATREFRIHIIRELAGRVVRRAIEKAGGNFS